ncbi:MAG: cysteine desulfurase family protein [Prochlorococcaceae cyanobacterium]|jgi:cysteine desulfurase
MTVATGLYLDACAATPPDPEVLACMAAAQARCWANPSSLHSPGLEAAEALERSRQELASLLGAPGHRVVFTSGGTEADNLAVLGLGRRLAPGRLVLSPLEHPAVVEAAAQLQREGWEIVRLPVAGDGRIDPADLLPLLAPPTRLVSIGWASSEIGTLQPMAELARLCRGAGVPLHCDAVQAVGQVPVDLTAVPVDLLSLSAHKFQGPRGVGALLLAPGLDLEPLQHGGGQEGGLRPGTEPVPLAIGLVRALALRLDRLPTQGQRLRDCRDRLRDRLRALPGLRCSGAEQQRLPHHLSLLLRSPSGVPLCGRAAVRALARHGVAVSSGSACSSGRSSPSATLLAIGCSAAEARSGLRLSLGPWIEDDALEPLPGLLESLVPTLPAADPS